MKKDTILNIIISMLLGLGLSFTEVLIGKIFGIIPNILPIIILFIIQSIIIFKILKTLNVKKRDALILSGILLSSGIGLIPFTSAGPNYASTCENGEIGGSISWVNPSNAQGMADGVLAYANATKETRALYAHNFGFNIPSDATINGITVEVRKKAGATSQVRDSEIYITKDGSKPTGNNKAKTAAWPTTLTWDVYGGSSDLWGSTFSPSDINSNAFGVYITADAYESEVKDQYQENYYTGLSMYDPYRYGQDFIPSNNTLTKVELYGYRVGSLCPTDDWRIKIHNGSMTGPVIAEASVSSGFIPTTPDWITFVINPPVKVSTSSSYYIESYTESTSTQYYYKIYYKNSNDYSNGMFHRSTNSGSSWSDYSNYDLTFRTYGKDTTKAYIDSVRMTIDYTSASSNTPPDQSSESPTNQSTDVDTTLSQLSVYISDDDGDLMNWTIQTSPNIGSSSGTNDGNGTKTCSVSGLQTSTTYTWYVNVTDGTDWTNSTYTFTTRDPYTPTNPPSFSATNVNTTSNSLSWTLGSNTDTVYIERNTIETWSRGAGQFIYNGTSTQFIDKNLNYNTLYYYRAWGYNDTDNIYSSSSSLTSATTRHPISSEYPTNGSINIATQPSCHILVDDPNDGMLTVRFYDNSSGSFVLRQTNTSVSDDSIVYWTYSNAQSQGTKYWWKVEVQNSTTTWSKTFHFTTYSPGDFITSLPCDSSKSYDYVIITTDYFYDLDNYDGVEYSISDLMSFHSVNHSLNCSVVNVSLITNCTSYWDTSNSMFNDTPAKIREFIKDAKNNWSIQYIFMIGDIPFRYISMPGAEGDTSIKFPQYWAYLDGDWEYSGSWNSQFQGVNGQDYDTDHDIIFGYINPSNTQYLSNYISSLMKWDYWVNNDPKFMRTMLVTSRAWSTQGVAPLDRDYVYDGSDIDTSKYLNGFDDWVELEHHYETELYLRKYNYPTRFNYPTWENLTLNKNYSIIFDVGHGSSGTIFRTDSWRFNNTRPFLSMDVACSPIANDNEVSDDYMCDSEHGLIGAFSHRTTSWWSATNPVLTDTFHAIMYVLDNMFNDSTLPFNIPNKFYDGVDSYWDHEGTSTDPSWDKRYAWKNLQYLGDPYLPFDIHRYNHDVALYNITEDTIYSAGSSYSISTVVVNRGLNTETDINVEMYEEGNLESSTSVTLAPGATTTVTLTGTAPTTINNGYFNVTVKAYVDNEEDWDKNNLTTRVIYGEDIKLSNPRETNWGVVNREVSVDVTNNGQNSHTVTVYFYFDGVQQDSSTVSLNAGETTTVSFDPSYTYMQSGIPIKYKFTIPQISGEYYTENNEASSYMIPYHLENVTLKLESYTGDITVNEYENISISMHGDQGNLIVVYLNGYGEKYNSLEYDNYNITTLRFSRKIHAIGEYNFTFQPATFSATNTSNVYVNFSVTDPSKHISLVENGLQFDTLQEALRYANTHSLSTYTFNIPEGLWFLSDYTITADNVKLNGSGYNTIITGLNGSGISISGMFTLENLTIGYYKNTNLLVGNSNLTLNNVKIINENKNVLITIQGTTSSPLSVHVYNSKIYNTSFSLQNTGDVDIYNVSVYNEDLATCDAIGFSIIGYSGYINMSNCTINTTSNIASSRVYFSSTIGLGGEISGSSSHLIIKNTTIYANTYGIGFQESSSDYFDDVLIDNCSIYGLERNSAIDYSIGIYFYSGGGSSGDIYIKYSKITEFDYGVKENSFGSDILFRNCSIFDNYIYGINNSNSANYIDAKYNYWGSTDGPGGVGSGSGDNVSLYVYYTPYLTIDPLAEIYTWTIRNDGVDYFIWLGASTTASNIEDLISGFDESSEYIAVWHGSNWGSDGLWQKYYGDGSGTNFNVNTYDIIKVYLTDTGTQIIQMTASSSFDYTSSRTVQLINSTNKGANYTGYTGSPTTLASLSSNIGLANGEVISLWDNSSFIWQIYIVGFWEPNVSVPKNSVIYTKVSSTRSWIIPGEEA